MSYWQAKFTYYLLSAVVLCYLLLYSIFILPPPIPPPPPPPAHYPVNSFDSPPTYLVQFYLSLLHPLHCLLQVPQPQNGHLLDSFLDQHQLHHYLDHLSLGHGP